MAKKKVTKTSLNKTKVAELKKQATDLNIDIEGMKKPDIVETLYSYYNNESETAKDAKDAKEDKQLETPTQETQETAKQEETADDELFAKQETNSVDDSDVSADSDGESDDVSIDEPTKEKGKGIPFVALTSEADKQLLEQAAIDLAPEATEDDKPVSIDMKEYGDIEDDTTDSISQLPIDEPTDIQIELDKQQQSETKQEKKNASWATADGILVNPIKNIELPKIAMPSKEDKQEETKAETIEETVETSEETTVKTAETVETVENAEAIEETTIEEETTEEEINGTPSEDDVQQQETFDDSQSQLNDTQYDSETQYDEDYFDRLYEAPETKKLLRRMSISCFISAFCLVSGLGLLAMSIISYLGIFFTWIAKLLLIQITTASIILILIGIICLIIAKKNEKQFDKLFEDEPQN